MVMVPPLGGACLPFPSGLAVGTLSGLASVLAGARAGSPIGSGAWGIPSSRRVMRGVIMKPSGHGQTSSST
jgi:hypothetical protein